MTDFERRHLTMLAELNKTADDCARKAVREPRWRRGWLCWNAAWGLYSLHGAIFLGRGMGYFWAVAFLIMGTVIYLFSRWNERHYWHQREELLQLRSQLQRAYLEAKPHIDELEE